MLHQFRNVHLYVMLAADGAAVALSLLLAYLLRFDFTPEAHYWSQMLFVASFAVPIKLGAFFSFGLYRGMWRYTDISDFWHLIQACLVSSLLIVTIILYLYRFQGYPRSVFFIDGMLTFLLTGGLRVCIRTVYRKKYNLGIRSLARMGGLRATSQPSDNILIIGAGDAGEKILREILDNSDLSYNVVGFLDDNPGKRGRTLHGVPILGPVRDLGRVIEKHTVDQVFIAIPTATGRQMRAIVETCENCRVSFKTLPGIGEIMDGKVTVSDLREVSYEDLLGRDPVELDTASIQGYLTGLTVFVSGAGGSIGSELCRQIVRFRPRSLIAFDASEYNLYAIGKDLEQNLGFSDYVPILGRVQDRRLIDRVFAEHRPHVVFHAAAYKHVPMLERNPCEAVLNNVLGSLELMRAAKRHRAGRMVQVSTDKAVNPVNVMGATKRLAEMIVTGNSRREATKFVAVRFGNVVGSSGSVIPMFKQQIARGGPVRVTHPEITRYFMTISEAAQLILQSGALGEGGEIFILDMGTPIKIADMARDLIRLMGKEPGEDVDIRYIGLRAGEKMREELYSPEESIRRTAHDKILVVRPGENGPNPWSAHSAAFDTALRDLFHAAREQDEAEVRRKLRGLVPEYGRSAEEEAEVCRAAE